MDTPSRTHRILIADDNEANRELLEAYLAAMDCEIDYAVDGQETIEKAKSFQPDLILLDIMMPKLSGFDCLLYTSPSPRDQRGSRMPSSA